MPIAKRDSRTGSTNLSERSTNLSTRFWQVSVAYFCNRRRGSATDATNARRERQNRPAHREHRPGNPRGTVLAYAWSLFVLCSAPGRNRPLHPPPVQPALPVAASRWRTTPQPRLAPLDYTRPRSRRQVFSLASAAARAPDSRPLPGDHPWAQTTTRGSLRSLPCACRSRKGGSTI